MGDVQSQNGWLEPYKMHMFEVRARQGRLRPPPPTNEETERPDRAEPFDVGRESSSLVVSIEIEVGVGEGEGEGDGAAAGGARTSSGRLRPRAVVGAATAHSSGRSVRRPMMHVCRTTRAAVGPSASGGGCGLGGNASRARACTPQGAARVRASLCIYHPLGAHVMAGGGAPCAAPRARAARGRTAGGRTDGRGRDGRSWPQDTHHKNQPGKACPVEIQSGVSRDRERQSARSEIARRRTNAR